MTIKISPTNLPNLADLPEDFCLTQIQFGHYLGKDAKSMRNMRFKGKIPVKSFLVGRTWMFRVGDIREFIEVGLR